MKKTTMDKQEDVLTLENLNKMLEQIGKSELIYVEELNRIMKGKPPINPVVAMAKPKVMGWGAK